jgi:glycosyltransferase involved in cell wall biosynthesis
LPKLLMVSTYPLTLRTFLLPYARHFRDLGWRVDALASGEMGRVAEFFDATYDIEWSKRVLDPRTFAKGEKRVREVVEGGGYDIVHVHTPVAAFVTRFALRKYRARSGLKVIYTAHGLHFHSGNSLLGNAPFVALERLAGRWTDRLVVMNREDEASSKRFGLVPERALRYMPGIGVDLSAYSGVRRPDDAALKEVGLEPTTPYFLCIAEFRPVKRHGDLLQAFARVRESPGCENARLLLAGSGPLEDTTRRLAIRLGLSASVHFLGFREDVPALLAGARALVLASTAEGLPRCVLEAMVAGVPVVATSARGTVDLLAEGAGWLAPPRDPAALAGHMREVLLHPERAGERTRRAAARVEEYSITRLLLAHEELYREALSSKATEKAA